MTGRSRLPPAFSGDFLEQVRRQTRRRAGCRRHGRADRRPPGQRRRARHAVRPCGARRRPQRHRQEGAGRPEEARARAAGQRLAPGPDHPGQLRRPYRTAARLRPDHRSHRRAHGLEDGAVRAHRAARRARRHHRLQYLRPVDRRAGQRPAGRAARPLLRHPFLQSAALHAVGGNHRHRAHPGAGAGPARNLADLHPGQGRDPRAGHAQLRGQPHRRVLHPGRHAPHPAPGTRL